MGRVGSKTSLEVRARIIELLAKRLQIQVICKRLGISRGTVFRVKNDAQI
jgi:DNA invertase Pin-like site-specific DNA recombinase